MKNTKECFRTTIVFKMIYLKLTILALDVACTHFMLSLVEGEISEDLKTASFFKASVCMMLGGNQSFGGVFLQEGLRSRDIISAVHSLCAHHSGSTNIQSLLPSLGQ